MTPQDHNLWIDMITARYITAMETDDFEQQNAIWELARTNEELIQSLNDIQDAMLEEQRERETHTIKGSVAAAMPSARIEQPAEGPLTVAEVVAEVLNSAAGKLDAVGHRWIAQLHDKPVPVPDLKQLSKLRQWIETEFGTPPPRVAEVFQTALQDLRIRRQAANAETYQLAARKAAAPPEPEGDS
jgi:hypothetical protein